MTGDRLEFGVLGPVVVRHGHGETRIAKAQQRCVLAMLLLDVGRVVPLDRITGALWEGDGAPRTARNGVQRAVSDLRRVLAVDPDVRLRYQTLGYLLEVDPARIDLHRFRALVVRAREAVDGEGRAAALRQALGLWRGEPLADVTAPELAVVKQALVDEHLSVLEECLDWEVRTGRHAAVVPELRLLVAAHPWRERLHGLLMLALYREGRPAEALQAFHDVRQAFSAETGTDPGPELRRLFHLVLRNDPELDAPVVTAPIVVAPGAGPAVVPRQLPAPPKGFTGRDRELAALDRDTGPDGTLVLSAIGGPGGIGKTWLALQWAHRHADRFPDGQLFVDLRGFSRGGPPMTPAAAVRGFLEALGVAPRSVPADLDARVRLFRSLVADRRLLVVADNARSADQVVPLLPGSPRCAVVVTSRNRLADLVTRHGAQPVRLDAVTEQESRQVLVGRLGEDRVAAEPAAVRELLACCGGFPLALAIVAGRAAAHPDFPLSAPAAELRDAATRLSVLDDDDPSSSLPAVLSWSHAALTDEQARAYALLGVAAGADLDLPAAASLVGRTTSATRSVLHALEDNHLVRQQAPGRWRMHPLIKLHAAELAHRDLTEADRDAAHGRLVDFHLNTAHASGMLPGPRTPRPTFSLPPSAAAHDR
ncbi:AfsR/SARP family transcriptional regulator [Saccharothrix sp. NRRL B-16314]|uniref:AfsR/SARP family transcriptional regulator n=1 Tax=Saccharothrix sp. NRRL B-16314 TaxID=1463825 RepID=UPI00068D9D24|nr:AfsR/SARP family transcriptional regulator [Saccharothrix sp. NRRL B-16314]